jgi:hypothetical protein
VEHLLTAYVVVLIGLAHACQPFVASPEMVMLVVSAKTNESKI